VVAGSVVAGAFFPELAGVPRRAMADLSSLPRWSVCSRHCGGEWYMPGSPKPHCGYLATRLSERNVCATCMRHQ
jgi:hypothetical protein